MENSAPRKALSVGQLAKRWGVGIERIRLLISTAKLPGAFEIPSSGRFGKSVRIPLETVLEAEEEWAVTNEASSKASIRARRRTQPVCDQSRHFPELMNQAAAECHEDDPN